MSQTYGGNARLEQRRRAAERARQQQAGADRQREEDVVLAVRTAEDQGDESIESQGSNNTRPTRKYQYPLSGLDTAPARIIFSTYHIEPFFDLTGIKNTEDRDIGLEQAPEEAAIEREDDEESDEDKPSDLERLAKFSEEQLSNLREFATSYKRTDKGTFQGSVTLPLQKNLRFQDGVSYNTAELGIIAALSEADGATLEDGRVAGAAKALGSQLAVKAGTLAVGGIAGLGLDKLPGPIGSGAGTIAGLVGGASVADQTGALATLGTRVKSAPNERTQFEKVNLRSFNFQFKMIARNRAENMQIKNIVNFFREELYPEAILIGDTPLAYEFPNVFQIDIRNSRGGEPAPKIQRCYLESVETTYNSSAVGMYEGEDFMEVEISLSFKEISALDKSKVRDGKY